MLDDPAGLSPENRAALGPWLERGGVALGLLGPASSGQKLSASLEPFAERSAHWESTEVPLDVDASSLGWLGPEAQALKAVTRSGRTRLEGAGLDACMRAAFEAIQFPPPPSERPEIVSYSVLFKPAAR